VPRLRRKEYYERHCYLQDVWEESEDMFSGISANKQWDIHAYYLPAKNRSDKELEAHREMVTKVDRSLPQRASKAFSELVTHIKRTEEAQEAPEPVSRPKGANMRVEVTGVVVRPEIDWDRFAWATLQHAKRMREEGSW
jgi:hypothetical protein